MEKLLGRVNRIIPFSNVDGPGNRLAIFFQGCNIRCIYCHNPETIKDCINCGECVFSCPKGALSIEIDDNGNKKVKYSQAKCVECDQCIRTCRYNSSPRVQFFTAEEILKEIMEYKEYIRGITVSGGEPTLQAPFITELFNLVKPLGLTCFVDTNGVFDIESAEMKALIEVTDKFMVDIKAVSETERLCGVNFRAIHLDNLKKLLQLDKVYEVRTVLIKNYMDMENTVEIVAKVVKDYPAVHYKIIRVHPAGLHEAERKKIREDIPEIDEVNQLAEKARNIGVKTVEVIL